MSVRQNLLFAVYFLTALYPKDGPPGTGFTPGKTARPAFERYLMMPIEPGPDVAPIRDREIAGGLGRLDLSDAAERGDVAVQRLKVIRRPACAELSSCSKSVKSAGAQRRSHCLFETALLHCTLMGQLRNVALNAVPVYDVKHHVLAFVVIYD
jgi:hypothetical protein